MAYRFEHNQHHANARREHDPDDVRNVARKLHLHVSILQWYVLALGTLTFIVQTAGMALWAAIPKRRWDLLFEYAVVVSFFVILAQLLTFQEFERFWLIPAITGLSVMNFRSLCEHEFTDERSVFTGTRSVLSTRVARWFMDNSNFHLEHHLFPGVPSQNLPKLHALLAEEEKIANSSVYSGYWAFFIFLMRNSVQRFVADSIMRIRGNAQPQTINQ
jgi:fatty acid desaturase